MSQHYVTNARNRHTDKTLYFATGIFAKLEGKLMFRSFAGYESQK
jgi:hypothetical protein